VLLLAYRKGDKKLIQDIADYLNVAAPSELYIRRRETTHNHLLLDKSPDKVNRPTDFIKKLIRRIKGGSEDIN